jgi:aspartyl-tRNA(Asn)/glutamyl-tRNA(Gln) amidotransferase subunit A
VKTFGRLSIDELGKMLRAGVLSCEQLTRSVLLDIEIRNSYLWSFVRITGERAFKEAIRAQHELDCGLDRGPLHGIPYAVKDVFDVAGQPNSAGTPLLDGYIAQTDAAVVDRLARAGAVLVGQTHTSPLAATILGINHARGNPRNPWKEELYLTGGSSSGSAVAVASGLVPFALGTDTGGSIRVPAALCGVVGLNPTVGRINVRGMRPLAPSFDSIGLITHTVRDATLVYATLQDALIKLDRGVEGLRIGVCKTVFFDAAQAEVRTAVLESARLLEHLGANTYYVELPEVESLYTLICKTSLIAAEGYPLYKEIVESPSSDWVVHWLRVAKEYSKERVACTRKRCAEVADKLASRTRSIDAIIVPTTPIVAPLVSTCDTPESHASMSKLLSRNTQIGKIAGWCSVSIPCGITDDGLPIGLMIYASARNEMIAIQIAQALETVTSLMVKTSAPPYSFLTMH